MHIFLHKKEKEKRKILEGSAFGARGRAQAGGCTPETRTTHGTVPVVRRVRIARGYPQVIGLGGDTCLQTTDNRQQTTDNRQQTTDNRQQTTDNRQQTTDTQTHRHTDAQTHRRTDAQTHRRTSSLVPHCRSGTANDAARRSQQQQRCRRERPRLDVVVCPLPASCSMCPFALDGLVVRSPSVP
jgi:hypothetical protein